MSKIVFFACLMLLLSGDVVAQQSLVGKYAGSFDVHTARGRVVPRGLSLEILSVKDNTVTGTAVNESTGNCAGEYSVAGTMTGNTLSLRETKKGGVAGDCGLRLELTVDGDKLVGTMGEKGNPVRLSK